MNEQSPDVRANKTRLLDDVFERLITTSIARRPHARRQEDGRGRGARARSTAACSRRPQAQAAGLIDGVADQGAAGDGDRARAGPARTSASPISRPSPIAPGAWPGRRVAVVLVDGTIVDGPSQELPFGIGGVAGSDTLLAALEECRSDPTVGAVVLRVNSPGGSAFASDVIARAIVQLRAAGKPVIASMGDSRRRAATTSRRPPTSVFAEPSTMTGSIGIFAVKVERGAAAGHARRQRRDLPPRRPRRLPVAVPSVDRRRR